MSAILKARYLITERILFHPAKCALGAVLGKAVALSGLESPPTWIQMLGDQAFLGMLDRLCVYSDAVLSKLVPDGKESIDSVVEKLIPIDAEEKFRALVANSTKNIAGTVGAIDIRAAREKLTAARRLLGRVASRRRPLLVYRLRSDVQVGDRLTAKGFATQFGNLARRSEFEREVEIACKLPIGAVVIHCLPDRPGMKIAKALVVGNDLARARHLRDVAGRDGEPYHHELLPFQREVTAIEEMYQSIWQFHVFLDVDHERKASLVRRVLFERLKAPNDELLESELPVASNRYDFIAEELWGQFGFDQLPRVIETLDALPVRHRFERGAKTERDLAVRAVESLFEAKGQLELPGDEE
jgi:phosphoglycolate phosphatase-like HAD superfamily hydrolase